MSTVLRLAALVVLGGAVTGEALHLVAAPGVVLGFGLGLGLYLWFLAVARRAFSPSPRRKA